MRLILLACAALALTAPAAVAGLDWGQPGGDPGRSGRQATDAGREPVGLVWSQPDPGARAPATITPGSEPRVQRVLVGVPGTAMTVARVVVRSLEKPGSVVGEVVIDDPLVLSDTTAFGTQGAVGIVSGASSWALVTHNDDGHLELARINPEVPTPLQEGDQITFPGSAGCIADTTPLLLRGVLYVVTGGGASCAALWRVPLGPDGGLPAQDQIVKIPVDGVNPLAAPALVTVGGTDYVAVSAGASVRLHRVDTGAFADIVAPLPDGDVAQGVLMADGVLHVAGTNAGGTRVHRISGSGPALTVTPLATVPGAPAPAMAASPDRLVVTTASGVFLVDRTTGVKVVVPVDGAYARTTAAVAGGLAYVAADDGRQSAFRIPSGEKLAPAFFGGAEGNGAAYGQPAIARGFVVFTGGMSTYAHRDTDSTAPTVRVTAPGPDAVLAGSETFSAVAGDARGVASVEFRFTAPGGASKALGTDDTPGAGNAFDPAAGGTFSASIQTGTVPNGTYVIDAVAVDPAGNRGESSRFTVRVANAGGGGGGFKPGRCANPLLGGPGPDVLSGTAAGDRIAGGPGDDRLAGGAGVDCLFGEDGNDRLDGGIGNDELDGGPGADVLAGASGDDLLAGAAGADRLTGSTGDDGLSGGADRDDLRGGSGQDRLNGGPGNDALRGDAGRDRITGGAGNDRIVGGTGSDGIDGGSGNDVISSADKVRDAVNCGPGRDTVKADRRDRVAKTCERVRRSR
jgi:hypothetical protein